VRGSPLELRRQSSDKQGVFFFFFKKNRKRKKSKYEGDVLTREAHGRTAVCIEALPLHCRVFSYGICSYLSVCFVYLITYSVKSLVDYINTLTRNVSGFINDLVGSIYFLHVMFYYSIGLCEMIEEFTL